MHEFGIKFILCALLAITLSIIGIGRNIRHANSDENPYPGVITTPYHIANLIYSGTIILAIFIGLLGLCLY